MFLERCMQKRHGPGVPRLEHMGTHVCTGTRQRPSVLVQKGCQPPPIPPSPSSASFDPNPPSAIHCYFTSQPSTIDLHHSPCSPTPSSSSPLSRLLLPKTSLRPSRSPPPTRQAPTDTGSPLSATANSPSRRTRNALLRRAPRPAATASGRGTTRRAGLRFARMSTPTPTGLSRKRGHFRP